MWVNQVCRLCAQVSDVLFPIFEKDGDRPRLDLKIIKCLSLMIMEEDRKPKQICDTCCTKLEDYNDFFEVCQSSDYKFESVLFVQTEVIDVKCDDKTVDYILPDEVAEVNPDESQVVQHESVIVVGNVDETQNLNRDCSDVLLMVEYNYKENEIDSQAAESIEQKIIYQENDIQDKQIVFSSDVLQHSDDFNKIQEKDTQNLDSIQYQETQQTYIEQPVELIKTNNSIQENEVPNEKPKPYPCSQCSKSFVRRSNLNSHMAQHIVFKPYHCDQCDRSFGVRWKLTVHHRIHTGLYTCEFCGKTFPVKGKLERHRRIHTGERPFCCHITGCDKAFADKRNLESHVRTHSEERPFACPICSRRFRAKSHVADHQKVHSQETPFTCDTCGKGFKWKTNLTTHLRSHSGAKIGCGDCGKLFIRTTQLTKHRRKHHSKPASIAPV